MSSSSHFQLYNRNGSYFVQFQITSEAVSPYMDGIIQLSISTAKYHTFAHYKWLLVKSFSEWPSNHCLPITSHSISIKRTAFTRLIWNDPPHFLPLLTAVMQLYQCQFISALFSQYVPLRTDVFQQVFPFPCLYDSCIKSSRTTVLPLTFTSLEHLYSQLSSTIAFQ